jgi:hypothetical protein
MKNVLWHVILIIFILNSTGCRKSVEYYFYEDGSVLTEVYENDSLYHITCYYHNGFLEHSSFTLKNNDNITGHFEQYYPDGFPKNKCEMRDGIGIGRPKETGKLCGYDILIDFGPYEKIKNGECVRPFRVFVDSVPMDEYYICIVDTAFCDSLPHQMPKDLRQYPIYNEKIDSVVDTVVKDETMYPYYIDDLPRITIKNTRGDKCFIVNIYYRSVRDNPDAFDSRLVIMHDPVHWEVKPYKLKIVNE